MFGVLLMVKVIVELNSGNWISLKLFSMKNGKFLLGLVCVGEGGVFSILVR